MAARQAFPDTTFTDPSGEPLANGYALIKVSTDVQCPSGMLCAGMTLRVALDSQGEMVSIPQVWPTDVLLPSGAVYILRAYTAEGELVFGPSQVQIATVLGFGDSFGSRFGS